MLVARISGAIFVLLMAYVVGAAAILPAPEATPAGGAITPLNMAGIAWFFAIWGALVASMVFIIAWTGASFAEMEKAHGAQQAPAQLPARVVVEAKPQEKVLAKAS
jgi:hypothetical protein